MRAAELARQVAALVRPPPRILPSEVAARYLRNERGPWSRELAPMMVEPLDQLARRDYRGIVFVGPARTGKTFSLVHGAITYAATIAADATVVHMSQDSARDFSRTEVDRILRHSPELAALLSASDDHTHDKLWRSGAMLRIVWPTVTNLAGRTQQIMLLTDYDRPANRDDVDGEGRLWDLAYKRVETWMSRGKVLAESSPGEDYVGDWRPSMPHEAPPARGIMSLYNDGTRARWHWRCLHCAERFEAAPGVEVFGLPDFDELVARVVREDLHALAAHHARVACRHCGGLHEMDQRPALNASGRWLHEGERFVGDRIEGERRRTPIVSYWLGGAAAMFQSWHAMIERYLSAVRQYAQLGDKSQLRASTTMDLGTAYRPRASLRSHSGERLRERVESWPQGTLPEGVRFLTQAVDVQGARFVVQCHGWGEQLESWLVDRYSIDDVDPAALIEDWQQLIAVARRAYPFAADASVTLAPRLTLIDSGGAEGVTTRAYEFWRRARRAGLAEAVRLVKGTGSANAPRTKLVWPDSSTRVDRLQGGRGDVPVLLVNVNAIKDAVANDLAREQPGAGFVHLPDWLPDAVFDELTAEVRTARGWTLPARARNEALDLAVYNRAAVIALRAENVDWSRPPSWASTPTARTEPAATPRPPPPSRRPWVERRGGSWMRR